MPVDFKKLLVEIEKKEGRCHLPEETFDTIDGFRIDCVKLQKQAVKLHYIFEESEGGLIFKILNGVIGYESFYVKDMIKKEMKEFWCACCLTKNRWDGLYVNGQQVHEKIRLKLNVFH